MNKVVAGETRLRPRTVSRSRESWMHGHVSLAIFLDVDHVCASECKVYKSYS